MKKSEAEAGRLGDRVVHPALALALVEEKRVAKPDTAENATKRTRDRLI